MQDALSQPILPTRGFLQGDPLAVTWAVLWAITFAGKVEAVIHQKMEGKHRLSIYLDDWTIASSRVEAVQLAMGLAVEHFEAWKLQLNLQKSVLLFNLFAEKPNGLELAQLATPESGYAWT